MFNLEDTGSAGAEKIDGDIAQLGERLPCKQEVAGSIPTISTNEIIAKTSKLQAEPSEAGLRGKGDAAK